MLFRHEEDEKKWMIQYQSSLKHVKGNAMFALKHIRAINGKEKPNKLWEGFEDFCH